MITKQDGYYYYCYLGGCRVSKYASREHHLQDSHNVGENVKYDRLQKLIDAVFEKRDLVWDDSEARKRLAKMIGLKDVPAMDPEAISRLSGYLGRRLQGRRISAVDAVREIRDQYD